MTVHKNKQTSIDFQVIENNPVAQSMREGLESLIIKKTPTPKHHTKLKIQSLVVTVLAVVGITAVSASSGYVLGLSENKKILKELKNKYRKSELTKN